MEGRPGATLPSRTSSASMTWFRFNGCFSAPYPEHPSETVLI